MAEEECDFHVDGLHLAGGDLRHGERGAGRQESSFEAVRR